MTQFPISDQDQAVIEEGQSWQQFATLNIVHKALKDTEQYSKGHYSIVVTKSVHTCLVRLLFKFFQILVSNIKFTKETET